MRIAVLCNGATLTRWQAAALDRIAGEHQLYLLACPEPAPARRPFRHALYYALNLASVRNKLTRRVPIDAHFVEAHHFAAGQDGAWATLPEETRAWVRDRKIDAIVKFGLGLLTVPDDLEVPILSYHHGDPRFYRGRPAGFYEIADGADHMGQIVQILSNRLDAGEVLAFGQTLVVKSSYRKTLANAYSLSPHLLPKALAALQAGERVPLAPEGRVYKLPENGAVARFVASGASKLFRRAVYGAFVEKRWSVAHCHVGPDVPISEAIEGLEDRSWTALPVHSPYRFVADPFFFTGSTDIFVEGLNGRTGKGEILRYRDGQVRRIDSGEGHTSFPGPIEADGKLYIVPETARWSSPALFALKDDRLRRVANSTSIRRACSTRSFIITTGTITCSETRRMRARES